MDNQVISNVKASNFASTLKLRNQIALLTGAERASTIALTFSKLNKDQKKQLIEYLQNSV